MSKTLGLDIGTNSIGWALVEDNKRIVNGGIRLFPIGTNVDDKTGVETTKNEQRRTLRGSRRLRFRFKLRRKKLIDFLNKLGMIPDFIIPKNEKEKYYGTTKLYELRRKAIDEKIELKEFGRILLMFNQHRGFQSNAKNKIEDNVNKKNVTEEEQTYEGKVSQDYIEQKGFRTIGEYYFSLLETAKEQYDNGKWYNPDEPLDFDEEGNKIRIRNRWVERRAYEIEFDKIWERQKEEWRKTDKKVTETLFTGSREECKAKRKLKDKTYKQTNYYYLKNYCIFYQRPLKSQKKYIGKCSYEKNKRCAPVSSLLYQKFRIWKQLGDLRIVNDFERNDGTLTGEEKLKLFNELQKTSKLTQKKIKEILNLPNAEFNEINELVGNRTLTQLINNCGENYINEIDEQKLENLWHVIYFANEDYEWLKDTLINSVDMDGKPKWGFEETTADKICKINFETDYGSYSTKAIKKIIKYMETEYCDEWTAKVKTGYEIDTGKSSNGSEEKIYIDKITPIKNNELRNPVVEKAVSETIRLVNAIIQKYGKPDKVRVESTRELRKPRNEREKMRNKFNRVDAQREQYAAFLNHYLKPKKNFKKDDSIINKFELWLQMGGENDVENFVDTLIKGKHEITKEKYSHWLECGMISPYTGKPIPLGKLTSPAIEIDHIIPFSRSADDSFLNKTVCESYVNRDKGNLTPLEYFLAKRSKEHMDEFKNNWIKHFDLKKQKLFLAEIVNQEFTQAQLRNASYIATAVMKNLKKQ
jgi:CRISPR-associated endonuclease Csn1